MATLPGDTKSTVVHNLKEFSDVSMMELTDSEVQAVFKEIVQIQSKYAQKYATRGNLDSLSDEITTKMYEMGVLVTFDPTPLLEGGAPEVEILGKIDGAFKDYGFDHEKEQWEVQRANDRGQEVYDEKG